MGCFVKGLDVGPFAECFVHDKLAFTRGRSEHLHQFIQGQLVEIFSKPEAVTIRLQAAN